LKWPSLQQERVKCLCKAPSPIPYYNPLCNLVIIKNLKVFF
jgi:hypothetical protein